MSRRLPNDQAYALAVLMLQLHDDLRRRRGLPPLPSASRARDDTWGARLQSVQARSSLSEGAVLGSHRRGVGTIIKAIRTAFWTILKPVFDRQSHVNSEVILALNALVKEREQLLWQQDMLSMRIVELEYLAGLRKRGQ